MIGSEAGSWTVWVATELETLLYSTNLVAFNESVNVLRYCTVFTILAHSATQTRLFDWVLTQRRLTKLGHTLLAPVNTLTLSAIIVFSPRLVRLVQEAVRAATLTSTHRAALG